VFRVSISCRYCFQSYSLLQAGRVSFGNNVQQDGTCISPATEVTSTEFTVMTSTGVNNELRGSLFKLGGSFSDYFRDSLPVEC
jgi:hypothetical protein